MISDYLKGMRENTKKNVYTSIRDYLKVVYDAPVVTDDMIDDYVSSLNDDKLVNTHLEKFINNGKLRYKENTLYNKVHDVTKYLSYNKIDFDRQILKSVPFKKRYDGREGYSKKEVNLILHYASYDMKTIILLLYSGMRPSEVLQLRWQDIDLERSKITIDGVKYRLYGAAILSLRIWRDSDRSRYVHSVRNKTHGFTDDDRIFPFSYDACREKFNAVIASLHLQNKGLDHVRISS
jgi:Phage integrase family.